MLFYIFFAKSLLLCIGIVGIFYLIGMLTVYKNLPKD
jgi:hypothetical protein